MSREEFASLAVESLDALGYEYTHETVDASKAEEFMLGAGKEVNRITVESPMSFTVDVVTAKSNPLLAFSLKFFSPEDVRDEMTSGASVVDIEGIDADSRFGVASLLAEMTARRERPPWKLTHHVGFRLAFLLRWKVKFFWWYWLETYRATEPDD